MIFINCWKIYKSLYGSFFSFIQKQRLGTHREFLKVLVEFLFLCNFETYAEMILGISFKEYPKYNYSSHKLSRKFTKNISLNFTDLFRKTPFVFKRDFGRPRIFISAKITPISQHQHIKITTRGYYFICRNSEKMQSM
jgi:hypothetical protein